ncbi:MAG: glycoside hydrolase family 13 protein [Clostridiales bacterium]|nr:glycoside hydrolase family 13 protein [Clostridiales bacterium]
MEIYNSRKKEYKSEISAVCENEKVLFRIILPRGLQCSAAFLAVHKDCESTVYYSMFWAGMHGEDSEIWQLHFSAETYGLYFYHFEIDTPQGRNFIKNTGSGIGEITCGGGDFQQTVYESGFETPDFLKGGIIYQIFPDRFYNSGEKKHGVPAGRVIRNWGEEPFWNESQMGGIWNNDYFGGDLKGIEQKLDYLSALGVSCIYLNPVFEANSNHRYDVADYEKIDMLLGDEESFKSLCRSAEKHGIAVVLDGVFSHTGCDSKYFNLYSHYPGVGAANSKDSPYYEWYKFNVYPSDYESWWGIKLLPEIDETNESFRKYICGENGILRKWLRLGASGWRLDVADELPDVFLDDLRMAVKAEKKDAVIIGEVWEDASNKISYSERRRYLLGRQLDSVMNYPFARAILDFVRFGGADAFFDRVMIVIENYPKRCLDILMNHIGTHDTERALNSLAGESADGRSRQWQHEHNVLDARQYKRGVHMLKIASLMQFTLPGVPSIYYADETGATGMADPFNRACFDWENIDKELLTWYQGLGKIRRGLPAFKDGEFQIEYSENNVLAYSRNSAHNKVLVAINNSPACAQIAISDKWHGAECLLGSAAKDCSISLAGGEFSLLSLRC